MIGNFDLLPLVLPVALLAAGLWVMRRYSIDRWMRRETMEDLDELIREKVWDDIESGKAGSDAFDYGLRSDYARRRFDQLRVKEGYFKARVLRVMKMRESKGD